MESTHTINMSCSGCEPLTHKVTGGHNSSKAKAIGGKAQIYRRESFDRRKLYGVRRFTDAASIHNLPSIKRPLQIMLLAKLCQIPQCRSEALPSHIGLVSTLVHLARRAHLHLQPLGSSNSSIESQVRRLLWHQISFLDLRVAEILGSQPNIGELDLETPLPLNVDDKPLEAPQAQPPLGYEWTNTTFTLLRYECYLVHRLILRKRKEIENGITDLHSVRRLMGKHKAKIERNYLNNLDESIPIQRCAKVVGRLLTSRFDVTLLSGYLQEDDVASFDPEIHDT